MQTTLQELAVLWYSGDWLSSYLHFFVVSVYIQGDSKL
jgi:hypothetical protein